MSSFDSRVKAVEWSDGKLRLLDQRVLPAEVSYLDFQTAAETATAIRDMVVRGAPAIGVTAAYAVVLAARAAYTADADNWQDLIQKDLTLLAAARPTAVNLVWAINAMQSLFADINGDPVATLLDKARDIHQQDIDANRRIGELGANWLGEVTGILTHCNAGALATGGYGTALGVIRSSWSSQQLRQVYANETRPWLQGARLTAWELMQDNIPVTLIADNAASHLMGRGEINAVVVGADRIAANGDVANKIGTYQIAIAARHHKLRFIVAAPLSTIDRDMKSGDQIPLEQRSVDEVMQWQNQRTAPVNCVALNPAFDITPAALIDAIVTEAGLIEKPTTEKIQALFSKP